MKSDFGTVSKKDFAKSIAMAFISAFITAVYQTILAGTLPTGSQWKTAALVGVGAMLSYIVKNFFTNSNDQLLKKEPQPMTLTSNVQNLNN